MMAMTTGLLQFLPFRGTMVRYPCQKCNVNYQVSGLMVKAVSGRQNPSQGENSRKRTWRPRKLSPNKRWPQMKRIPFAEEQEKMIRDSCLVETVDIAKLLNEADNKYQLVLDLAAEATEFQIKNKRRSIDVHPLSKVISDRMNEDGIKRPDGYIIDDTYGLVPDSWVRQFEC
ncbi:hypothetical protein SUGI_0306290 [Cryptomeria japonica]|uniref:protein PLASTID TRANSCRIPTIONALLY ACTIVE 7 n=1 Tax=Cryptomeria japonica TaxID=3369 RepID=UPI0024089C21|nr:protein PLASTID TRANSCRIPTIONALLY ACTIVE 7 [Cryptomeria japonica]GLJ17587.1 hypothetical protein SUGI_0306290 [Cryptomeria japonica]